LDIEIKTLGSDDASVGQPVTNNEGNKTFDL
jgi:hypothetical protein